MTEKEILISQFIDNELNLEEKITFVKEIHTDPEYFGETLELLDMEIMLKPDAEAPQLPVVKLKKPVNISLYTSLTALAASLLVMFRVFTAQPAAEQEQKHRFVVYVPEASQVALTGSFSAWQPVQMENTGNGYWQINLPLKSGEYSYSYLIDGETTLADPTVPARQDDGFGGENSVLSIGDRI